MEPPESSIPLSHPSMKNLKQFDYEKIAKICGLHFRSNAGRGIVKMKKTQSGAYFVDSDRVLQNCVQLAKGLIVAREAYRSRSSPHFMGVSESEDTVDDYVAKHIDDDSFEGDESSDEGFNSASSAKETKPSTGQNFKKKLRPEKLAYVEFPSRHVLNQSENVGWLKKVLGKAYPISEKYLPKLEPIMQDFASKHTDFKYYEIIDSLGKNAEHKYQIEVSQEEMKRFFSKVIDKVKPVQLFGSRKNDKIIKNAVFKYLNSRRGRISFDEILDRLDLRDVKWLTTNNIEKKMFIIRYPLMWFVNRYLLVILETFFYKAASKDSAAIIYVPIKKWIQLRDDFIKKMTSDGSVESSLYRESDNVPPVIVSFQMKGDGLRPIYQALATNDQKVEASYLKQLLLQTWAKDRDVVQPSALHEIWLPVVKTKWKSKKPFYIVTADIADAYGSIIQDKLLSILDKLLIVLPDELLLTKFKTLDPQMPKDPIPQRHFYDDSLPLLFPPGTITACCSPEKGITHSRDSLRERLKHYIKNQIIMIDDKCYKLSRGVGQGLPFAPILADIYYGTMESMELQEFKRDGTLIRYVDDFLYVTDKEESAEKFLALVKEGIPGYNCFFKPSKTHTNLGPNPETKFRYLGYKIYSDTLEVEPDYATPPTEHTIVVDIDEAEAKVFRNRMLHSKSLKLNRIVLDPRINSRLRIESIMKSAARRSALKCRILVIHMLDMNRMDVAMIRDVIDEVIHQLLEVLGRYQNRRRFPAFILKKWLYEEFLNVFMNDRRFEHTLTPMLVEKIEGLPEEWSPYRYKNYKNRKNCH